MPGDIAEFDTTELASDRVIELLQVDKVGIAIALGAVEPAVGSVSTPVCEDPNAVIVVEVDLGCVKAISGGGRLPKPRYKSLFEGDGEDGNPQLN